MSIERGETESRLPVTGSLTAAYVLSGLVAALLLVASGAGLLYGGILYDPDPKTLPTFYGQDALSLLPGLPLLLGAMVMTRRGSLRGLLLWTGMLFYVLYSYYFYLPGVPFGPLFPAYVALVSASLYALLVLLARMDPEAVRARFDDALPVRGTGGFLAVAGVLFILMWLADVVRRLATGEPLDRVSHAVYAIDLTLVLPAMVAVGVALWRRRPWGYALAGLLLVKVVALMATLLVNTALVARGGQPVDPVQTAAFGATLAVALGFTAAYLRAVRAAPSPPS